MNKWRCSTRLAATKAREANLRTGKYASNNGWIDPEVYAPIARNKRLEEAEVKRLQAKVDPLEIAMRKKQLQLAALERSIRDRGSSGDISSSMPPALTKEGAFWSAPYPHLQDPEWDYGAGGEKTFGSETPTNVDYAFETLMGSLTMLAWYITPDAAKHMLHFLDRSGADYEIDMDSLLEQENGFRPKVEKALAEAQAFSMVKSNWIKDGSDKWYISFVSDGLIPEAQSSSASRGWFRHYASSENWFLAMGNFRYGYEVFGTVTCENDKYYYDVDVRFRVADRYNWNKGQTIGAVDDDSMARLHVVGLGREYTLRGSFVKKYGWITTKSYDTVAEARKDVGEPSVPAWWDRKSVRTRHRDVWAWW